MPVIDYAGEAEEWTRARLARYSPESIRDRDLHALLAGAVKAFAAWMVLSQYGDHNSQRRNHKTLPGVPLTLWFETDDDRDRFMAAVGAECDTRVLRYRDPVASGQGDAGPAAIG